MALLFKRKTSVEKLETELAALRARAKTLGSRHAAADAALVDAKAKLQVHLLEADLDGDEKARTKLEAAVAACALTRDGLADALAEVQTRIAGAEKAIEAERSAVQRNAAADALSRELDEIEKALPGYLAASRRFADAIEAVGHWHFDSSQIGTFARNTQAQIEIAAAFAVEELRRAKAAHSLSVDPGPKKVSYQEQGSDPYNSSGSFDRKKNWTRVGKR